MAVLGVVCALGTGVARGETVGYPPPPTLAKGEVCPPKPAPTRFVTRRVGETVFRFPAGYISPAMGYADSFLIYLLLPCWDPPSPENQAEFDWPGWGRKLMIFVRRDDGATLMGADSLKIRMRTSDAHRIPEIADAISPVAPQGSLPASVRVYPGLIWRTDVILLPHSDPLFFVTCRQGDHLILSPSCSGRFRLTSTIVVEYGYHRTWVEDRPEDSRTLKEYLHIMLEQSIQ
jgi:hypothetical protein